ncbi:MAG: cysteine desulfurase [Oscillospiraceae bacterium]|jgi:cysteine desulfurase|nr:cysteine desulfurase [Oscillospiraceae bacterium]
MQDAVYLDNSATTPVLPQVWARVQAAMAEGYFNPSAAYAPAAAAERALDACRSALRGALGARDYGVIFTSGGTEADALALLGLAGARRGPMAFYCSAVEHPAVRQAMAALATHGHSVAQLPVDERGVLDIRRCEAALGEDAALVSVMQVNNETGAVQPLAALRALMRARCPRALLHVDGVQGFLRVPIALQRDGVDMYTLSAHKVHGPKGCGALLVRPGVRLAPLIPGGGQEGGLRGGTENTPGILGLHAAVDALRGMPDLAVALAARKARLWMLLHQGDGALAVNGPLPVDAESAPHILNVSFPGVGGEVMLHALESRGVYVSTGSACSSRREKHSAVLAAMGLSGDRLDSAIRFSLSPLNTDEEIAFAAQAALALYAQLKDYRRR